MKEKDRVRARLLWTVAALLLVVSVAAGCGGDDDDDDSGRGDSITVGFISKPVDNPFFVSVVNGAKAAADKLGNVDVVVESPRSPEADEQIAQVETMITRGVDALAIAPNDPAKLQGAAQQAINQGIPVVVVDTDMPELADKAAYVGTNNVDAGRIAGDYVKEQVGGEGKVAILTAAPGVTSVDDREQGFKEGLEGSGVEIVTTAKTDCEQAKALGIAEDLVTANADLAAIFSPCDLPILAALTALKNAGKSPDDMVTVGFDAQKEAVKRIQSGDLDADVAQFPFEMGRVAVETAVAAARDKKVKPVIETSIELVTKENAQEFLDEEH